MCWKRNLGNFLYSPKWFHEQHAAHTAAKEENWKITQLDPIRSILCLRQATCQLAERLTIILLISIVSLWLTYHVAKGTTTVQVPAEEAMWKNRSNHSKVVGPIPFDSRQLGWSFHNASSCYHRIMSTPGDFGTSDCGWKPTTNHPHFGVAGAGWFALAMSRPGMLGGDDGPFIAGSEQWPSDITNQPVVRKMKVCKSPRVPSYVLTLD